MGNLSAILDLEPETGGDDNYAEVGRKRTSRQLGGLVTGSRLAGNNLRAWHRLWRITGNSEVISEDLIAPLLPDRRPLGKNRLAAAGLVLIDLADWVPLD